MNFNHDTGLIDTILSIDTTQTPPLGGQVDTLVIVGVGSVAMPAGATGDRPATPAGGMLRFNNDSPTAGIMEFYDGTTWQALAASSGSISSVTVTTGTGLSVSSGSSQTITSAGTFALTLDANLTALSSLAGTGFVVQTGANTFTNRSISGTAGNIVVSNGDGISASPTIDLDTVSQAATGSFVKVTLDGFGRVTGNTPVVTGDVTALVDGTYVNVAGDTMTGNLVMGAGTYITLTDAPTNNTDAVNKAYVDALTAGLSWKQSVVAGSTGNLTLSGAQTVDGVALVAGDRVLVKDQTNPEENGIYIVAAGAWTRAPDMDAAAEFDGSAIFIKQGTTLEGTGWTEQLTVTTVGTDPVSFTQFSGTNTYIWGTGLSNIGNTISVNLGAGIFELGVDGVGIELYDSADSALILTTDGTTRSTSDASKLHLLIDAAGGLTQTATGLAIDASGITNTMLVNDSFTVDVDGVGTLSVALGDTLNIYGATNRVSTSIATGNVIVDISANYVGQTSITTLGTVTTGTWNGDVISTTYGGTGVDTSTAANGELLIGNGSGLTLATLTAGTGIGILNAAGAITISNTGVTSVALSAPSIFTVSGSPVTTTGTLTFALADQIGGTVFAGPSGGPDSAPTFRELTYNDLPLRLYAEAPQAVISTGPEANGTNAVAIGMGSKADQYGSITFGSGSFVAAGDSQHGNYILRNTTTDATETQLFLDGSSIQYIVPVNSVVTFIIMIAGRRTDAVGGGAGYKVEGVVRRDTSTASTTLIGGVSRTVLGETNSQWNVSVSVDTSTGALRVFGRGEASKTVRWVAVMQTAEVTN